MALCLLKSRALSQTKHAVRRFCEDECGIVAYIVTVQTGGGPVSFQRQIDGRIDDVRVYLSRLAKYVILN